MLGIKAPASAGSLFYSAAALARLDCARMPSSEQPVAPPTAVAPTTGIGGLTSVQWKSGIAAWLGWFFDGLELHLYTLVAAPLVAHLLNVQSSADPLVK